MAVTPEISLAINRLGGGGRLTPGVLKSRINMVMSLDSVITVSRHLSANPAMTLDAAVSLEVTRSLIADPSMTMTLATALTVERNLQADINMALTADATLYVERLLSANPSMALSVDTNLYRLLGGDPAISMTVASTIYHVIQANPSMSMTLDSTLTVGSGIIPSDISDLYQWYDATDVNSGAEPTPDDNISSWQDKSGNGLNLGQANSARYPQYKTNIQNSLPGVLFDGTSDNMNVAISQLTQPVSYVCAWNPTSGADDLFFSSGSSEQHAVIETGGNLNLFAGSSVSSGLAYPTTAGSLFAIFDTSGTGSYARINGTDGTKYIAIGSAPTSGTFYFCANSAGTGNYYKGYIFEFLVYNKLLSPTEIGQLETYLNDKWGL